MADEKQDQDRPSTPERPQKGGKLSCGSRVCLHCHSQCGAVMANYLSGLDEGQESNEEDPEPNSKQQ